MSQSFLVYSSRWRGQEQERRQALIRSMVQPTADQLPAPVYISLPSPSRGKRATYGFIRGLGAGLVAFSVLITLVAFGPVIKEEFLYLTGQSRIKEVNPGFEPLVEKTEAERASRVREEAKAYGVDSSFSVVIPKIGAASQIIANVDTTNEEEYRQALLKGVAQAKGTYFPGQGKRIYLFAHSTDFSYDVAKYNAVFFLLRNMEAGDKIIVFFADRKYIYGVYKKVTVPANDVSWLTGQSNQEELVLQTCDPPGTTWRRLIVAAKLTSEE